MFTFGHDHLASLDQTLIQRIPFFNDINIFSSSPSFDSFQPYKENYDDPSSFLQELLQHHQQEHGVSLEGDGVLATKDHALVNEMVEKSETRNGAKLLESNQRNKSRSCKKDRHSKIDTAHGPRDRRMRLSLEVARKFFGLQDMLKFDKASKTVEWLLTKSKSAIEEVEASRGHIILKKNSSSNTSNSSSSNNDNKNNNNNDDYDDDNNNNNSNSSVVMRSTTAYSTTSECEVVSGNKIKRKKEKGRTRNSNTRKCRSQYSSSSHSIVAKEAREKARERAKQRTREKNWHKVMTMMMMTTMSRSNYKDSYNENCEESGTQSGQNSDNNMRNPHSLKMNCEDQLRADQEMVRNDDSAPLGKWSSCPASSSFTCDLQGTGINHFSSEQHDHFHEFPLYNKSWEGYPNQFLC